jgi:hypothetical protein
MKVVICKQLVTKLPVLVLLVDQSDDDGCLDTRHASCPRTSTTEVNTLVEDPRLEFGEMQLHAMVFSKFGRGTCPPPSFCTCNVPRVGGPRG